MQIENIHYCRQSLQEENIVTRAKSRQNIDETLITQFHDLRTIEILMNRDEMNAISRIIKFLSTRRDRDMNVESSQRNIVNDNFLSRQIKTSLL